jgi:hypothetical protein
MWSRRSPGCRIRTPYALIEWDAGVEVNVAELVMKAVR